MLFGPDVSNYQRGINMAAVAAAGCDFVSAKVTEGSSYRSPAYPAQRDQAIAAGLIFYGYHYVTTDDPAAQARNCQGWLGDKNIAVMLDWENNGGDAANLRHVADAFRAAGIRLAPVYAPHWYWQKVGSPDLSGLGALVGSSYPSTASGAASALFQGVGASRWASYGGLPMAILQFTDRAAIAGLQIDCNAYPGTRQQLISLLYGSAAPTTPTPTASRRRRYREAANDMRDKIIPRLLPNGTPDPTFWTDGRFTGPFGGGSATIEAAWVTASNAGSMELEFWCEKSVNGVKTGIEGAHYTWQIGQGDAPSFGIPQGTNWVYYQARKITGTGDVAIDIRPRP